MKTIYLFYNQHKSFFHQSVWLLTSLLWCNFAIWAQNQTDSLPAYLNNPKDAYELGHLDRVIELIEGDNKKDNVSDLKLLANAYIYKDEPQKARIAVVELIKFNPNVKLDINKDSPKFVRLVQQVKKDMGIITSFSKTAESYLETAGTVTVISHETIIERGYNDLVELLTDLPGFDISKSYGRNYATIHQRGFRQEFTQKTLLLINGLEENDLNDNTMWLSRQYPLSNIERVEIIYGPASTIYGSNAMVGAINIVTKTTENLRNGLYMDAHLGGGSFETRYADVNAQFKTNDWSISVTGRLFRANDFLRDELKLDKSKFEIPTDEALKSMLTQPLNQANGIPFPLSDRAISSELFEQSIDEFNNEVFVPNEQAISLARTQLRNVIDSITTPNNQARSTFLRLEGQFKNLTVGYQIWQREETNIGDKAIIELPILQGFVTNPPGSNLPFDRSLIEATQANQSVIIPEQQVFYFSLADDLRDKWSYEFTNNYRTTGLNPRSNRSTFLVDNPLPTSASALLQNRYDLTVAYDYYFRYSSQFRSEAKLVYNSKYMDFVTGIEFRDNNIQAEELVSSNNFPITGIPSINLAAPNAVFSNQTTFPTWQERFDSIVNPQEHGIVYWEGRQFTPTVRQRDYSWYAQNSLRLNDDAWKLVTGLRVQHNIRRTNDGFGTIINPRLALVYNPENFAFKASYARGFQDASVSQEFSHFGLEFLPLKGIQPERLNNYELYAAYYPNPNLVLNVAVYHQRVQNLIEVENEVSWMPPDFDPTAVVPNIIQLSGPFAQYQNRGTLQVTGLQAEGIFRFDKGNAYINYTRTRPRMIDVNSDNPSDFCVGEIDGNACVVGDIATHRLNMGGSYNLFPFFTAHLRMNYVGERKTIYEQGTTLDPYVVMHTTLTYYDIIPGISLQATINNLTNTIYQHPGVGNSNSTVFNFANTLQQAPISCQFRVMCLL